MDDKGDDDDGNGEGPKKPFPEPCLHSSNIYERIPASDPTG